ncbi:ML domain-containing protein [Russula earlei]|uniref:ML domain-containing protein n=1 Tax=Russula earlei TaxID=71964 RepID=A0ACC0UD73_9AGAM|nr:ML domain-containing protein [Russula earlei]
MARLLFLTHFLVSFLASTNVIAQLSSQQPVVHQDGPLHTTDRWSWVDCGSSSDVVRIESINNLTVTVRATAQERIEEGAFADVLVKLGLIKLLHKEFDLCQEARDAQASIQCPVDSGEYVVEHTVALPKEVPQAKFTINARGYTVDQDDLFCVDLKVDFMKRPFPKFSLGW